MKHSIKIASIIFFAVIIFSNINCKEEISTQAPEKPTVVSPENNETLDLIPTILRWKCTDVDSKDLTYDVYFGKENPPSLVASNNEREYYTNFTVESQQTYYWKIVAKDESGNQTEGDVWTFTMGNFPPETPENPVPANSSYDQNPTTISWECTEPDGETLSYDIYFGTNSTPELVEENYTQTTFTLPKLKGNQKYFWRIVARDTEGNEINGPIWNFKTNSFAPEAIYPIDNEQNTAWFPKFKWNNNNIGTFKYDLYFGTNDNPELLVSDLTEKTYHSDRLTKEETYYWKVIAKDEESGKTVESPVWSFKVFGNPVLGTYFDVRDNYTYQTVKIGNQTWFAENLRYNLEGSRVYDDDPANEAIYGRLYTWEQMMNGEESSNEYPSGVQGIAPPGAHIPSKLEWLELINFLGGEEKAGKYLKEAGTEHWLSGNTGNNESGFLAVGAGIFDDDGLYSSLKEWTIFWTSSNRNPEKILFIFHNQEFIHGSMAFPTGYAFSVRCIINN